MSANDRVVWSAAKMIIGDKAYDNKLYEVFVGV